MISGVDGKWTAKIEDIARPKILHANRLGDTLIKGIADLQLRLLLKDRPKDIKVPIVVVRTCLARDFREPAGPSPSNRFQSPPCGTHLNARAAGQRFAPVFLPWSADRANRQFLIARGSG